MTPRSLLLLGGALVAALLAGSAHAQTDARWGRLSDADRAITAVASDPDASAVVLWDAGSGVVDFLLQGRARLTTKRHRRVKVFSEAGYALGEFRLHLADHERLGRVRGQTFVPQPDGSYRRVALARDAIVRSEVAEGVEEVRFSMPGLEPGAIFEVEYRITTDQLFSPPPWRFQSSEPTLVSRYRFQAPGAFQYVAVQQGPDVESEARRTGDIRIDEEQRYEWVARDVPALRPEPYTTAEADHVQKLELQLRQIRRPGEPPQDVIHTWEEVAEQLAGHADFGRRLARGRRAAQALAAQTADAPQPERARRLYDVVREGFVWTGEGGVFADRSLEDVAESRSGSTGELNLLLLAMLREAGIAADPVLLSTRSNGRVLSQYPLMSRFDHLVVLAQPETGPPALLDATDPNRPFGLLPVEALSGEAWVATPGATQWITFQAHRSSASSAFLEGDLSPDGTLRGGVSLRLGGYPALDFRARRDAESESEAALGAADPGAGTAFELHDVRVTGGDDPYAPVVVRAECTARAAERIGDELYLTPFVMLRQEANPFLSAERTFPVDFAYPEVRSVQAVIRVPDGYGPEAVPEPVQVSLPSGAVGYTRLATFDAEAATLRVQATLSRAASSVGPEEYAALRALYDDVVAAESEVVVLVPTGAQPPAGAAPGPPAETAREADDS